MLLAAGDGSLTRLETTLPDAEAEDGVVAVANGVRLDDVMGFFNIGVSNTLTQAHGVDDHDPPVSRFLVCPDCPTPVAKIVGFIVAEADHAAKGCWIFEERIAGPSAEPTASAESTASADP